MKRSRKIKALLSLWHVRLTIAILSLAFIYLFWLNIQDIQKERAKAKKEHRLTRQ